MDIIGRSDANCQGIRPDLALLLMSEEKSTAQRRKVVANHVRSIWERERKEQKLTQESVAESMGVSQGALSQYLNDKTPINLSFLRKFLGALGLSLDDMPPDILALVVPGDPAEVQQILGRIKLAGAQERLGRLLIQEPQPDHGFTYIHKSSLVAGLGEHRYAVDSEQVVDSLAFKTRWLQQRGFDPEKLALISCSGDSMSPTLQDKDLVLVDLRPTPGRDGIYAVIINHQVMVKRLRSRADGSVTIVSDNPAYPPEDYPAEVAAELVHKIGRVVWVGREFS